MKDRRLAALEIRKGRPWFGSNRFLAPTGVDAAFGTMTDKAYLDLLARGGSIEWCTLDLHER